MKKDTAAPGRVRGYSLDSYDENFCLKPPTLLWVALIFLSRAVALPLVLGLATYAGVQNTGELFAGALDVQTFIPSAVAALVLLAAMRRKPSASRVVRWIWAHGRALLALSAALDAVLLLANSPVRHGELNNLAVWPTLATALDLYFLVYVLAARQVRDVFSDFPAALESPPKSQSA
jgi:hypothetical protein